MWELRNGTTFHLLLQHLGILGGNRPPPPPHNTYNYQCHVKVYIPFWGTLFREYHASLFVSAQRMSLLVIFLCFVSMKAWERSTHWLSGNEVDYSCCVHIMGIEFFPQVQRPNCWPEAGSVLNHDFSDKTSPNSCKQIIRWDKLKVEPRRPASNGLKFPHPKYLTHRTIKAGVANDLLQITGTLDTYWTLFEVLVWKLPILRGKCHVSYMTRLTVARTVHWIILVTQSQFYLL